MNVVITLGRHASSFYDDGEGVADLNDIVQLGSSGSASSSVDIGQFGWGAKHALATFGQHWRLETIYRGRYHSMVVPWNRLIEAEEKTGVTKWPDVYDYADGVPLHKSGSTFEVGTRFTTSQPLSKRGQGDPAVLRAALLRKYAPALRQGRTITIDYYGRETIVLDRSVAMPQFNEEYTDERVAGERHYRVHWGLMTKSSPSLSGIHIAFGHRVIDTKMMLGKYAVTPQFYALVDLERADWKDQLSVNKNHLNDEDALLADLEIVLGPLMKAAQECTQFLRMEDISAQLADQIMQRLVMEAGGTKTVETEPGPGGPGPGDPPGPNPRPKPGPFPGPFKGRPRVVPKGDPKEAAEKTEKINGIQIEWQPFGPIEAWRVKFKEGVLVIALNTDNRKIAEVQQAPFKTKIAWPIICDALTSAIVSNEVLARPYQRQIIEAQGGDIDGEVLRSAIYNKLLLEDVSVVEPKVAATTI